MIVKPLFLVFSPNLVPGSWEGHCRIKVHSDKPIKTSRLPQTPRTKSFGFGGLDSLCMSKPNGRVVDDVFQTNHVSLCCGINMSVNSNVCYVEILQYHSNTTSKRGMDEVSNREAVTRDTHRWMWCGEGVSFELSTRFSIFKHTWIMRTSIFWFWETLFSCAVLRHVFP